MKIVPKLPTILGILILVAGLIAGIFLIDSRQIYKLGATTGAKPNNVRVSNISDTSLTITWTTDIESSGFVKWGETNSSLDKVATEDTSDKSLVHSVNILGLERDSTVYFKINSNGNDFDNDNIVWQTKTLNQKVNQDTTIIASGTVLQSDTVTTASAIVTLSINGVLLSSITSNEGNWIISVSSYFKSISENTVIEISVNAGPVGTSQAVIYPKAISAVPTMILGKTYDFRSIEGNPSGNLPKSSISIPDSVEISSRFEVTKQDIPTNTETVTIESINNNEIINTTDPEFFGKGPKNTNIEVKVESELQEASLTTNSKGVWNWSPPNNLTPGEHKITVKWKDATGIFRTVTRTFIVQASEGPAFESTPSAAPIKTATPTSSPVATISSTPVTTSEPTPETGSLTPTIGLFIMGIGILFSSVYVWNKEYA